MSKPQPPPRRPVRIGLLGYFGAGNFGNDGSLEAMRQSLARTLPDAELTCIGAEPEIVTRRTGLGAIGYEAPPLGNRWLRRLDRALFHGPSHIARWIHALRHVRRLDAIIVPGTGILDDYGTGWRGMPYGLLCWSALARLVGAKVCLVSIGAGPIHDPTTRRVMGAAARLATFRSFRDRGSRAFVTGLGIDTSADAVTPDIAFGLAPPRELPPPAASAGPLTVGLGVILYYGWRCDADAGREIYRRYVEKIAEFTARLLEQGHGVRLLTGETTDWSVVEDVVGRVRSARPELDTSRLVAERATGLADVMEQAGRTDVVIASRFHNVVCALNVGRPVISIGYAAKNDDLLQEMSLGSYCQHIERLDIPVLEQQLERLIRERDGAAVRVRAVAERYRAELREQEHRLLHHICGPAHRVGESAPLHTAAAE